jgi:signal transduction histidine kinase
MTLQELGDGRVVLSISDDGIGFETTRVGGSTAFGLQGMHERAALIGAQLDVRSRLGDGSAVIVTVPPRPAS